MSETSDKAETTKTVVVPEIVEADRIPPIIPAPIQLPPDPVSFILMLPLLPLIAILNLLASTSNLQHPALPGDKRVAITTVDIKYDEEGNITRVRETKM